MKTPLYEEHVKLNAHIVDFHGWDMPLYYEQIITEHLAVRNAVGIFDVSHMGDILVSGKDAASFLDYLFPTAVSKLKENSCVYTSFLDDSGKMIDDCICYLIDKDRYLIIPNAATKDKVFSWMNSRKGKFSVNIADISSKYGCIAVQGPRSRDIASDLGFSFPEPFKWLSADWQSSNEITNTKSVIISGTGYTGEKGIEIIAESKAIVEIWKLLVDKLANYNGKPCGLGSRDTLRMEKGMLLSGTDFNEDRTPTESSISFIIDNSHNFIGKNKIDPKPKVIFRGIVMKEKGIPRTGDEVFIGDRKIGSLTSGGYSPSLSKGIGLGFMDRASAKLGQEIIVSHNGKKIRGVVVRPKMFPLEIPPSPS